MDADPFFAYLEEKWKRSLSGRTAEPARRPCARGEPAPREEQRLVVAEAEGGDELRALSGVLLQPALVGDLAAALGVEGRLAQLREEEAVAELLEGAELGEDLRLLVADELRPEAGRARELGRPLELAG